MDKLEYMIKDSKVISKRVREIESTLEIRYGKEYISQIYLSLLCIEGKELFDKLKNMICKTEKASDWIK